MNVFGTLRSDERNLERREDVRRVLLAKHRGLVLRGASDAGDAHVVADVARASRLDRSMIEGELASLRLRAAERVLARVFLSGMQKSALAPMYLSAEASPLGRNRQHERHEQYGEPDSANSLLPGERHERFRP